MADSLKLWEEIEAYHTIGAKFDRLIEDLIREYRAAAEILKDLGYQGAWYPEDVKAWLERNGVKR